MGHNLEATKATITKPVQQDTLKCCRECNLCYFTTLTKLLRGCPIILLIEFWVHTIFALRGSDYTDWRHDMLDVSFELQSENPQPWRFTNNSLGLAHAHFFSVCLFLRGCVVCVCFLLCLSFYLYFVRCVLCVLFHIHHHLFQGPIHICIHITLCLRVCRYMYTPVCHGACIFITYISETM